MGKAKRIKKRHQEEHRLQSMQQMISRFRTRPKPLPGLIHRALTTKGDLK